MDVLSAARSANAASASAAGSISVVVPVFNEEAVLAEFHRRLAAVLDRLPEPVEIVYVNDGSHDGTMPLLAALHDADPRVAVVDLSRNFGKEVAMSAGLDHANGDAVVVIDADLQDPPELIPDMIRAWHEGHDVVLMRRRSRAQESWFKKATARAFYRAIGRIGTVDIPENVGDFRLLSHRAVTARPSGTTGGCGISRSKASHRSRSFRSRPRAISALRPRWSRLPTAATSSSRHSPSAIPFAASRRSSPWCCFSAGCS